LPGAAAIFTIDPMRKGWWFGGLAALALCSSLWARQGVVYLKSGGQISGDIDDSNPLSVTITLHDTQEILPRSQIRSIAYPGGIDQQFKRRMAKLAPDDVAGRLSAAQWAFEAHRYDLAQMAAAQALAIDPGNDQALELMQAILFQIHSAAGRGAAPPARPSPALAATAPATAPAAQPYLSLDQVNEIRQLELKPNDGFQVAFDHGVRKRFLQLGLTDATDFYAQSRMDQARQIMAQGNAALVRDVRILTDPASLAEFRARVQPMIMGGCAVSGCHDSKTAAGGFGLFTQDDSPQASYSNFYILQTFVRHAPSPPPAAALPAGTFAPPSNAGGQRLMIDRIYPNNSLLVQYALLPSLALTPHPAVADLRPVFVVRNDPRLQSLLYWIGLMLKPDGGRYPDIHYRPPWANRPPPAKGAGK
jgi:hypothetical protein